MNRDGAGPAGEMGRASTGEGGVRATLALPSVRALIAVPAGRAGMARCATPGRPSWVS